MVFSARGNAKSSDTISGNLVLSWYFSTRVGMVMSGLRAPECGKGGRP